MARTACDSLDARAVGGGSPVSGSFQNRSSILASFLGHFPVNLTRAESFFRRRRGCKDYNSRDLAQKNPASAANNQAPGDRAGRPEKVRSRPKPQEFPA